MVLIFWGYFMSWGTNLMKVEIDWLFFLAYLQYISLILVCARENKYLLGEGKAQQVLPAELVAQVAKRRVHVLDHPAIVDNARDVVKGDAQVLQVVGDVALRVHVYLFIGDADLVDDVTVVVSCAPAVEVDQIDFTVLIHAELKLSERII